MTTHVWISMAVFIAVAAFFPAFFVVNRLRGPRTGAAGEPLRWHWLQAAGVAGTFVGLMLVYIEYPAPGAIIAVLSAAGVVVGAFLKGGRVRRTEMALILLYLVLAGWAVWAGVDRLT